MKNFNYYKIQLLVITAVFLLIQKSIFAQVTGDLYFNADSSIVSIPDNSGLQATSSNNAATGILSTNAFTIEVWFKACSFASSYHSKQVIASKRINSSQGWSIGIDNLTGVPYISNSTWTFLATGTKNLKDGIWHHLAVLRHDAVTQFYVDGQLIASNNAASDVIVSNSTGTLHLGGSEFIGPPSLNSDESGFIGYISEFRFWNKDISSAQITLNWNKRIDPALYPNFLTAYYRMDERQGQSVNNLALGFSSYTGMLGITTQVDFLDPSWIPSTILKFNGLSNYIAIPKCTSFDLGLSDFTFEARIKASTSLKLYPQIMSYRDQNLNGFLFGLYQGKLFVQIMQHNYVATVSNDLRDNVWHNVAVTRQGKNINFYIDGSLYETLTTSVISSVSSLAGNLTIGYDIPSPGNTAFNGDISNVSIWNFARSATSIAADKSGGDFLGNEVGLISYWPLNEGTGSTVFNKVSGCNAGTLTNNPTWVNNNCSSNNSRQPSNSINTPSIESVSVYPNPVANGFVNFGKTVNSYSLTNSVGVIVKTGFNDDKVNMDGLAEGLYILKMDDNVIKIIKE